MSIDIHVTKNSINRSSIKFELKSCCKILVWTISGIILTKFYNPRIFSYSLWLWRDAHKLSSVPKEAYEILAKNPQPWISQGFVQLLPRPSIVHHRNRIPEYFPCDKNMSYVCNLFDLFGSARISGKMWTIRKNVPDNSYVASSVAYCASVYFTFRWISD